MRAVCSANAKMIVTRIPYSGSLDGLLNWAIECFESDFSPRSGGKGLYVASMSRHAILQPSIALETGVPLYIEAVTGCDRILLFFA
jgi:hypothetical protein